MVRRMANPYFDVQYKRMLDINGRGGPVFEADKHGTLAMVKSLKTGTALVLLLDLAVGHGIAVNFMGRPSLLLGDSGEFRTEDQSAVCALFLNAQSRWGKL